MSLYLHTLREITRTLKYYRVESMQKSTLLSAGRESERLGDIWVNGHDWTKVESPQSSRFHFKRHASVRAEAS